MFISSYQGGVSRNFRLFFMLSSKLGWGREGKGVLSVLFVRLFVFSAVLFIELLFLNYLTLVKSKVCSKHLTYNFDI